LTICAAIFELRLSRPIEGSLQQQLM
jgi:hypothetical protein